MKRIMSFNVVWASLLTLCLVFLPKAAVAGNPSEDPLPEGYYFCHHLGNDGYNSPNASSAGVVFGHLGDSHQDGLDIIPPFTYQGTEYSQNWDAEGQAIHANGCEAPEEPTATTAPEEPTATTVPEQPTATTAPEEPTATTGPEQPTATTAPGEPTATNAPAGPTATTQVSVLPVTGSHDGGSNAGSLMLVLAAMLAAAFVTAAMVVRGKRS